MFGCYRKQDANDPDIYVAAVTSILAEYPQEVVEKITDPRTGLPSRLKWLPTVAEVRSACEEEMGPARFLERRAKLMEDASEAFADKPKSQGVVDGFKSLSDHLARGFSPSTAE